MSAIADQASINLLNIAEENINIYRVQNNISFNTPVEFFGRLVDTNLEIFKSNLIIGSIPKERADEFAINTNITIEGDYRDKKFSIPDNSLSIFSL